MDFSVFDMSFSLPEVPSCDLFGLLSVNDPFCLCLAPLISMLILCLVYFCFFFKLFVPVFGFV